MTPTSPEPLPVERFAALNAEIDAGLPIRDVLEREEISEEDWEQTQKHWLSLMAEEAERKRFEVTNRYGTVFKTHRAVTAAKLKMSSVAAPPDTEAEPAPEPEAPAPDTEVRPAAPSAPPRVPPSYPPPRITSQPLPASVPIASAGAAPPSAIAPPPVTQPAPSTQPTPAQVATQGLPFAEPPAAPPADPGPVLTPRMLQPLESEDGDEGGQTMVTEGLKAPASTLPFQRGGHGPAHTMVGEMPPTGEALPFKPDAEPKAPSPSSPPPAPKKKPEHSGTLFAVSQFIADPLPFDKNKKVNRATVALPPVAPAPQRAKTAALPMPGALTEKPHFSLEHFASLCAEIAHDPKRVEEVRRRYGLTREQHREEATRWRALFDANPRQGERFTKLVEQYRAYLHSRGDGG